MGSPAKASAAATGAVQEEGQEAASNTDRGHANGGPAPAKLDLNIKALMGRRKQLRQEKQEVAKTLLPSACNWRPDVRMRPKMSPQNALDVFSRPFIILNPTARPPGQMRIT